MSIYKEAVFPGLRQFDAERTHEATLNLLSLAEKYSFIRSFLEKIYKFDDPRLEVKAMDLHFDNPIGLAAGFDKNGVATRALAALGFGHIEVGTITPMSQVGNPRPRIFRLSEDAGLVNRMGFPGEGMVAAKQNLETAVNRNFVMGINAGDNGKIEVPVVAVVPGMLMGSGLGHNDVFKGNSGAKAAGKPGHSFIKHFFATRDSNHIDNKKESQNK